MEAAGLHLSQNPDPRTRPVLEVRADDGNVGLQFTDETKNLAGLRSHTVNVKSALDPKSSGEEFTLHAATLGDKDATRFAGDTCLVHRIFSEFSDVAGMNPE